jgi:hypothetical protein
MRSSIDDASRSTRAENLLPVALQSVRHPLPKSIFGPSITSATPLVRQFHSVCLRIGALLASRRHSSSHPSPPPSRDLTITLLPTRALSRRTVRRVHFAHLLLRRSFGYASPSRRELLRTVFFHTIASLHDVRIFLAPLSQLTLLPACSPPHCLSRGASEQPLVHFSISLSSMHTSNSAGH